MKKYGAIALCLAVTGCGGGGTMYTDNDYGPLIGALQFDRAFAMALNGYSSDLKAMGAEQFVKDVESRKKVDQLAKTQTVYDVISAFDSYTPHRALGVEGLGDQSRYSVYKAFLLAAVGKENEAGRLVTAYVSETRAHVVTSFGFCNGGIRAAKTAMSLGMRAEALAGARISVMGACAEKPQYNFKAALGIARQLEAPQEVQYLQERNVAASAVPECKQPNDQYGSTLPSDKCNLERFEAAGLQDLAHFYRLRVEQNSRAIAHTERLRQPSGWTTGVAVLTAVNESLAAHGAALQALQRQREDHDAKRRASEESMDRERRRIAMAAQQADAERVRPGGMAEQRGQQQASPSPSSRRTESREVTKTINIPAHTGCVRPTWKQGTHLWTLELHNTCAFPIKVALCFGAGCAPGQALRKIPSGGVDRNPGHGKREAINYRACQLRSGEFDVVYASSIDQCQTKIRTTEEVVITPGQR